MPKNFASIQLAQSEVTGSINLYGRSAMMIDVRVHLSLAPKEMDTGEIMGVDVEQGSDL